MEDWKDSGHVVDIDVVRKTKNACLGQTGCDGMDWVELAHDRAQCWTFCTR
jgi:hypothetical protein